MIIGFWVSLFVLIISIIILVVYDLTNMDNYYFELHRICGLTNISHYDYFELPYWIFGILVGISLFFVIFFAYYGKMS